MKFIKKPDLIKVPGTRLNSTRCSPRLSPKSLIIGTAYCPEQIKPPLSHRIAWPAINHTRVQMTLTKTYKPKANLRQNLDPHIPPMQPKTSAKSTEICSKKPDANHNRNFWVTLDMKKSVLSGYSSVIFYQPFPIGLYQLLCSPANESTIPQLLPVYGNGAISSEV